MDKETYRFKKEQWLKDNGYTEGDVMENEIGEYVLMVEEAEDHSVSTHKVYLEAVLGK